MSRVVRFGAGSLADLGEVLDEIGVRHAVLVTTQRGGRAAGGLPVAAVYDGVLPHVPVETVREAAALVMREEADGLVALGGGSSTDTAKAIAAEALEVDRRLPVVAIPTTYAGAEWTPFYGVLYEPGRKGGGSDERVKPVAAVYDPLLSVGLPLGDTVGTALNALAHCAEAYYTTATTDRAKRHADTGAAAISYALPLVVGDLDGVYGRTRLLEGAMRAARALEIAGLALAHALPQAIGGSLGIPQGTAYALCLPAALRFNAEAVPEAVARFAGAMHVDDAAGRCEELARLGGFDRLRDLGVTREQLPAVAETAAGRPGAKANPRPVDAGAALALLESIW